MALDKAKYVQFDFDGLVEGIRNDDPDAVEQLYNSFQKGLRWYMARRGVPDGEDLAQDVFLVIVSAIQRGELRDPKCLPGFVRGVARNIASEAIRDLVKCRTRKGTLLGHPVIDYDLLDYHQNRPFDDGHLAASRLPNAEHSLLERERTQLMFQALSTLRPKEREILERFYLQEHTCERICKEMNLSETQYRLLKSRAKTHLTTFVRRSSAQTEFVEHCGQTV
jgi:RNA polymerase sigma factor (sigma-70 family)